jgi:indolepyruvate ferredoxin oxidoreductase alpha subunit
VFVTGDIGCYTLGALPPLTALDTCLCMGAGIGQTHGINQACGKKQHTVAVIGDSTFVHSGITGLINIAYNNSPSTVIILDNGTTAMTGGQDHPGTGTTLPGEAGGRLDFVALCRAIGIGHVEVLNPRDLDAMRESIKAAVEREEPSVLIASHPCVLLTRERPQTYEVDTETCNQCGACLRLGCPAIAASENAAGDKQPAINRNLCHGCRLCVQVCPQNAIFAAGEAT